MATDPAITPSQSGEAAALGDPGVPQEERGPGVPAGTTVQSPPVAPPSGDAARVDVSATTITRMMGIATVNDLRLVEGRVDVLTSKVAALISKVDRVLSMFNALPTSTDMDRLEIQVGSVKTMVRELSAFLEEAGGRRQNNSDAEASEQGKKIRESIKSNQD